MLDAFGDGWRHEFEPKLKSLFTLFPSIVVESISNFEGMLRIKLSALDNDVQYVLDCVTFKIERESAVICEICGKRGKRSAAEDAFLKQRRCLCWACYAMEIDSMESHNIDETS